MRRTSHSVRTVLVAAITAVIAVGTAVALPTGAASAATTAAYTAVSPTRILDTRHTHAVAPNSVVRLGVAGTPPVPAGATAVAMTVTVTQPASAGYITAWPEGIARPTVSNINFTRGQTVPNLVVVPIGSGGRVDLFNGSSGTVQLIADVAGYFSGSPAPQQGTFGPITPVRRLDTRTSHAVAANGTVSFSVTGQGVPADASAVVVNLTVTGPAGAGSAAAYPSGGAAPVVSNLNFVRGQTVADLAVVRVGAGGQITIVNRSTGPAQFVADISGYFAAGDPVAAGALGALSPARVLDTRTASAVPANGTIALPVVGRVGVPLTGVRAVVLTVTVTQPRSAGYLTVYADGASRPTASNLDFTSGQTVPDAVIAPVGSDGKVAIHNGSGGTVQVVVDLSGYLRSTAAPLPAHTSVSRYVRNLTTAYAGHSANNAAVMDPEGCADAQASSSLVVLDIGAQSQYAPLTSTDPGVVLTQTSTRLDYAELVAAVKGYLDGFLRCGGTSGATIAVATNNDGNFTTKNFDAQTKGTQWADQVVDPIVGYAAGRVHVVGADDIEAGFASTEADAEAWENAYLGATSADLLFIGSADGCPTAYGTVRTNCAAIRDDTDVTKTWSQANYYRLAGGISPSRVRAAPQTYVAAQARQWANITATGGAGLVFAGALTEYAACPTSTSCGGLVSMTAPQGWAALYHALSTVIASPSLPAMTDLLVS